MAANQCVRCGKQIKNYNDSIMAPSETGEYIPLCLRCFNKKISEDIGVETITQWVGLCDQITFRFARGTEQHNNLL